MSAVISGGAVGSILQEAEVSSQRRTSRPCGSTQATGAPATHAPPEQVSSPSQYVPLEQLVPSGLMASEGQLAELPGHVSTASQPPTLERQTTAVEAN